LGVVADDDDNVGTSHAHNHTHRGTSTMGTSSTSDVKEVLTLDEDKSSLEEYAHRFRLKTSQPTPGNAFSLLKRVFYFILSLFII
jgi:hypothetical protein